MELTLYLHGMEPRRRRWMGLPERLTFPYQNSESRFRRGLSFGMGRGELLILDFLLWWTPTPLILRLTVFWHGRRRTVEMLARETVSLGLLCGSRQDSSNLERNGLFIRFSGMMSILTMSCLPIQGWGLFMMNRLYSTRTSFIFSGLLQGSMRTMEGTLKEYPTKYSRTWIPS